MATEVGSGTSYAPGASSLADLRRCVLDYVQGADVAHLNDIAKREINMAIDRINAHDWKRLFTTQDITPVAGTLVYNLENDFKEATHCVLLDASGNHKSRLYFKGYKTLMEEYQDRSSSGEPSHYTIDHSNRQLVLLHPPDATFVSNYPTIRLFYQKRLARLTNAADKHGGPPEFDMFICWYGRASLAAIQGELNASGLARQEAEILWRALRVDDKRMVQDWPDTWTPL